MSQDFKIGQVYEEQHGGGIWLITNFQNEGRYDVIILWSSAPNLIGTVAFFYPSVDRDYELINLNHYGSE